MIPGLDPRRSGRAHGTRGAQRAVTMTKKKRATGTSKGSKSDAQLTGQGDELHQIASPIGQTLTTNLGTPISDDQNSLRIGARGPTLLEDFVLREKISHFDHERIPERVVHARGSAAHGYFQPARSMARLTSAAFLQDPRKRTPVFARFSTVAGSKGSADLPRDVRGFAVKFYTEEGNFDLVGNNIPVFFIQDAIKFPDLIHAVKPEPDRGFPQAQSAHDTFWDFVSLMPESMHMLTWVMSDRAIPRSLRMMEGFGVHTFRLINAAGKSTFVKFHWRPTLGSQSVVWDEALKLNGADPDFHRRDLHDAIAQGDFPEWQLFVQAFDEKQAARLPFDVLDPTKLIPEEVIPLELVGKMVLDRNPDNFFAETEQVAFLPSNFVPGIDASDDPLLQGRLFSYQDTQLLRLGGPNFHQIPINRPKCPMHNFQRDGHMQMDVPKGRVAYEPSSLSPGDARENPKRGFVSHAAPLDAAKQRTRSPSFADHYSQARLFFRSMSEPEQRHIVSAFAFELAKVETIAIRTRMLGHLDIIDQALGEQVAAALGMEGKADPIVAARAPIGMALSPTLSLLKKAVPTLKGRKVGVLVADGTDDKLVAALRERVTAAGAKLEIVAPKIAGALSPKGKLIAADHSLSGGPSCVFDAVAVLVSEGGAEQLATQAAAIDWLRDAFGHPKIIGHTPEAQSLLARAGIESDDGVSPLEMGKSIDRFVTRAKAGRIWERELSLRAPG
jgi:catalase